MLGLKFIRQAAMWKLGFACALGVSAASAASLSACNSCSVGAEGCGCTEGGSCDVGLTCLSKTCVSQMPMETGLNSESDDDSSSSAESSGSTATSTSSEEGDSTDSGEETGPKLDGMAEEEGGFCNLDGCRAIDVLFAIDGSLSMQEELNALSASSAFSAAAGSALSPVVKRGNIGLRVFG